MWYAILQTKATKSKRGGGRSRGEVWSTEYDPKVQRGVSRTDFVAQVLVWDGGQAEVLAEFPSYKQLREAMLLWHRATNKAVRDGAFSTDRKASNDFACDLARKVFRKYRGKQ